MVHFFSPVTRPHLFLMSYPTASPRPAHLHPSRPNKCHERPMMQCDASPDMLGCPNPTPPRIPWPMGDAGNPETASHATVARPVKSPPLIPHDPEHSPRSPQALQGPKVIGAIACLPAGPCHRRSPPHSRPLHTQDIPRRRRRACGASIRDPHRPLRI